MFYRLPPAGNRICLRRTPAVHNWLAHYFQPYRSHFFASGTEALAASLLAARRARPGRHEVVLAGYNCPALVSAIRFAGCREVLVDIEPERPQLALPSLERAIGESTLAIIGVDLFGLPERYERLGRLAAACGAYLIQDAAQRPFSPQAERPVDVIIQSFGRGKPVSVLGGGVALVRDEDLAAAMGQQTASPPEPGRSGLSAATKLRLYNALRHPRLYWLPAGLPFLHLGQTRYQPLSAIRPANPQLLRWLPANIGALTGRPGAAQMRLAETARLWHPAIEDLSASCDAGHRYLSRFPLLAASAAMKQRLVGALARFGASPMYPAALPAIPGVRDRGRAAAMNELPNACEFAARVFTLPLHEWMDERTIERLHSVVMAEIETRGLEAHG